MPTQPTISSTTTTVTHPRNGWMFTVQPLVTGQFDPELEAPFRLVRANGKGQHREKAYRLMRNRRNPQLCFLIAEDNPFSSMSSLNIWFQVDDQGLVTPVQVV